MTRSYTKRTAPALAPYKNVARGGNKVRQKSSPQSMNLDMVATKALELRIAGKEFKEIAAELAPYGVKSKSGAYEAVQRAFTLGVIVPNNQLREIEVMRLEKLHAKFWPQLMEDDPENPLPLKAQIETAKIILEIGAQRQKVAGLNQAPETNQQDKADMQKYLQMAQGILANAQANGNTEVTLEYILAGIVRQRPQAQGLQECFPTSTE